MTIITYGESKSVIGRKHANNPWSNHGVSVKGSSRSLSRGGRRGHILSRLPVTTAAEIELEIIAETPVETWIDGSQVSTTAKKTETHTEPFRLDDGVVVWLENTDTERRSNLEHDIWKPTKIRKVPKWDESRLSCTGRGHAGSGTKEKGLQANDRG